MLLPLGQDDWWICQKQDCAKADRVSPLEAQVWIQWLLAEVRTDRRKMSLLEAHLVRNKISTAPFHLPHGALVRQIEQLFIFGRLHVHKKRREIRSGAGGEQRNVPFPLAERQPRIASEPAPIVDAPVFAANLSSAAQAAALIAAAAGGTPFCQE